MPPTSGSAFPSRTTPTGAARKRRRSPYVAQWIGEDQIISASDYPHWDEGWPTTVDTLLERTDLSDAFKRKILGENALGFYNLRGGVAA